jgi:hypothetical protein
MKDKERGSKSFLLRIPPELYDTLSAWAAQELRSVNGQIEYLLKEAVARRNRVHQDEKKKRSEPEA